MWQSTWWVLQQLVARRCSLLLSLGRDRPTACLGSRCARSKPALNKGVAAAGRPLKRARQVRATTGYDAPAGAGRRRGSGVQSWEDLTCTFHSICPTTCCSFQASPRRVVDCHSSIQQANWRATTAGCSGCWAWGSPAPRVHGSQQRPDGGHAIRSRDAGTRLHLVCLRAGCSDGYIRRLLFNDMPGHGSSCSYVRGAAAAGISAVLSASTATSFSCGW
jgi:hypothetical protein